MSIQDFAPDDGAAPAGGSSPAPTPAPAAAPSAPEPAARLPLSALTNDRTSKVISVSEGLGLPTGNSGKETMQREIDRLAGKRNNIPLPTRKAAPKAAVPAPVAPAAPVEVPTPTPAPAPTPATPTAAPTPVPTPTTKLAPKVKVGDKEYTQEELQALIEKANPPAPAAPAAATPAAVPTAPETPEQIAARKATEDQAAAARDKAWITEHAATFKPEDYGLSEETLDKVLSGGKEAVSTFMQTVGQIAAAAELNARKFMASEVNRKFDELGNELQPVLTMHQSVQQYQEVGNFEAAYPELKGIGDKYQIIKDALIRNYPEEVSKMTQAEFQAEIAGHIKENQRLWGATQPTPAPTAPASRPAAAAAPQSLPVPVPIPGAGAMPPELIGRGSTPVGVGTPAGTVAAPVAVAPSAAPMVPIPPSGQIGGIGGATTVDRGSGTVNRVLGL